MTELEEWIRFSESSVVKHRDGLFSASSGNPAVPNWVGRTMLKFFFTEDGENEKYAAHIRSSAGVVAFVSRKWTTKRAGLMSDVVTNASRCSRLLFGLRHAHINQAVEVPEVRDQFATYLGIGDRRPDLLVRFGYGPRLPQSLRRSVDQVIVS